MVVVLVVVDDPETMVVEVLVLRDVGTTVVGATVVGPTLVVEAGAALVVGAGAPVVDTSADDVDATTGSPAA